MKSIFSIIICFYICISIPSIAYTESLPDNISTSSLQNLEDVITHLFDEDKLKQVEQLMQVYEEFQPESKKLAWFKVRLFSQKGEFDKASSLALSFPPEIQTGPMPVIEAARRQIMAGDIEAGVDFLTLLNPEIEESRQIPCQLDKIAQLFEKREDESKAMLLRKILIEKYPHCKNISSIIEKQQKQNLEETVATDQKKQNSGFCQQISEFNIASLLSLIFLTTLLILRFFLQRKRL